MNDSQPLSIAVVSLSGVFPGAIDCNQFWRNIRQKVDTTQAVAEDRWRAPFDWVTADVFEIDKAYSRNACRIEDFDFNPSGFNINEALLREIDPMCQWVLHTSKTALGNTNIQPLDKRRIGVILAAIALPTEISSSISRDIMGHQLVQGKIESDIVNSMSQAVALSGRVVAIPAAMISQGLGLGGINYTLDAACASSLYAIKLACDELRSHRADAMLAGGVSRPDSLYTQIGFSQLRALSPSGRCAPFDQSADGLVVGEGAGIMVLKRLEDAIAHGDTIHGVIRGIGLSNDMRGNLLAPESDGQIRAMRAAYAQADWQVHDVDYIECHAAGTTVGDTTELQSLRTLWGEKGWQKEQCAIGSVKSMIGHLLTGAGAAGMIKTLLSLSHKTLPPSLKYSRPKQGSPLIDGPFRVETDGRHWPEKKDGSPRKAAVSAFGFGGINAHVLLEEWQGQDKDGHRTGTIEIQAKRPEPADHDSIAIVGMNLHLGALDSLTSFQKAVLNGQSVLGPAPSERWKASTYTDQLLGAGFRGNFINNVSVDVGEFQIPPDEIPGILPQQLLMLKVAAGAMADAGLPLRQARERMSAIIGIGFDYEATNFHLRWALPSLIDTWKEASLLPQGSELSNQWLNSAREHCGPPLTATRTLGALGGIVASRIAREFRFGGPSFVVSAEEASGLQAVEIAKRMLQSREVDAALVGAVDLNCDERNMATLYSRLEWSARGEIRPFDVDADGTLPGEGAVALVLKRLEDAKADKDRIYAVIEGIGSAGGSEKGQFQPNENVYLNSLERALGDAQTAPDRIDLMECHASGIPSQDATETNALHKYFGTVRPAGHGNQIAVGTIKPIVGHTGVTSGLASLAKAAVGLFHHIIPPVSHYQNPALTQWRQGIFHFPIQPVYWSRNRSDGPRKACVASMTSDGQCMHAVLGQAVFDRHHEVETSSSLIRPLGPLPYGLFIVAGKTKTQLQERIARLESMAANVVEESGAMESLARKWHLHASTASIAKDRPLRQLGIVASSQRELVAHLAESKGAVEQDRSLKMVGRGGVCYDPAPIGRKGQIAFIYPGSGNHYVGMGRTLGAHWPDVLREMSADTDLFKSQLLPQWCDPWRADWSQDWTQEAYAALVADPLHTIFAQVMFGGQLTGLIKKFNIHPDAVVGYSLGESAGLFALGAWPDRGQMLDRLERSALFKSQLAGAYDAVRQAWEIPEDQSIDWKVAAVNRNAKTVDEAISDLPYVRRLIVNTPDQCVIGGLKRQVQTAVEKMNCTAVYLDGVVSVHCDAALPVADAYRDLHVFDTTPIPNVRFYSCAYEKALDLTADAAAASIARQATNGFDFSRAIERVYADGVRIFIEIGPHCSCTRMITQILDNKPHLAVAANHRSEDEPLSLLKCLGTLAAADIAIDLDPLYGYPDNHFNPRTEENSAAIKVPVGGVLTALTLPMSTSTMEVPHPDRVDHRSEAPQRETLPTPHASITPSGPTPSLDLNAMIDQLNQNVAATAKAHEQFLALSQELTSQYGKAFEWQNQLLSALDSDGTHLESLDQSVGSDQPGPQNEPVRSVAFDRDQCMQFAIGSVGRMLGTEFDEIDTYAARVRLPDEPLMLVDRIVSVEGEKLSLGPGRVITEHDVVPGAWYLDGNRAPVCISVEAGQADLFLCAYLGIDHKVKGERTYRLLDAKISFHRGLPQPGETIRYDIRIDKFVRQEATYLFFFRFEGYIGDDHLITMTNGCAGFFTEDEVRNSGGIILTDDDKSHHATIGGAPYEPLVDVLGSETYDEAGIDALRDGDAEACFGTSFRGIQLPDSLCLPKDRMRLIHRVVKLDPVGGRFGKGLIKAEADIQPDDWFLTCHFVDDMVMPGTLMYECCAHTLRVLLLRMGWITDAPGVCYEPIQKMDCQLKCRGPVTPTTQCVQYVVEIKEMGYHPEPYVIADAHMYADGHYIVFFKDMSMQMTHATQQDIQRFWQQRGQGERSLSPVADLPRTEPPFTRDHILEFAIGRPSKAFGQPYVVFDRERTIARLPGPPYCFMDRVTAIEPEPWIPQPGGWVEAQYDVPADAWYFAADASGEMPFCVLLEIALQPCGWLAAYVGSALISDNDLKFRNLGGKAVQHANIPPSAQTLTMRTRITKVSDAADMIIEHFEFEVHSYGQPVYTGTTYFGFFSAQALAQQVGLREAVFKPGANELDHAVEYTFEDLSPLTPDDAPSDERFEPKGLNMPGKALRMIDGVDIFCPDGGPNGLGYIRGYKVVDTKEWFFKAHFFQDPVCPGSLGIESFLQLIKFAAMERWPHLKHSHRFESIDSREHQWSYRGQVIPKNKKVIVEAVVTQVADGDTPLIMADGCLQVDGIYIYKMGGFGLRLKPL